MSLVAFRPPPITPDQRATVRHLRDVRGCSWAHIAHLMQRREETLRQWYERDKAEAQIAAVKKARDRPHG